jgi:ankyrin repeat protein
MHSIRMNLALLVPTGLLLAFMLAGGSPKDQNSSTGAAAPMNEKTNAKGPTTGQVNPDQARKDGLLLISSSEKGDAETVKSLLKKGVYIHTQDREGRCALVAAAYKNNMEIVDLLIAAGADVNMKDNTLQSAYLISTSDGYTELLKKTLKAGADVHCTDSFNGTGLIRAADRGHVEVIQELLKTKIRVNHVNRLGWTALLEAIILGDGGKRHTEVVRLLVAAGADVNLPDKDGTAPLAHAKNKNFAEIIKILESSGAK